MKKKHPTVELRKLTASQSEMLFQDLGPMIACTESSDCTVSHNKMKHDGRSKENFQGKYEFFKILWKFPT